MIIQPKLLGLFGSCLLMIQLVVTESRSPWSTTSRIGTTPLDRLPFRVGRSLPKTVATTSTVHNENVHGHFPLFRFNKESSINSNKKKENDSLSSSSSSSSSSLIPHHHVTLRAGGQPNSITTNNNFIHNSKLVIDGVSAVFSVVLPPIVTCVRSVVAFYKWLPTDAITAQAGLVYCFAGGYFPTLFAAVEAAQHSGLDIVFDAMDDLIEQATIAIDATLYVYENSREKLTPRQLFQRNTAAVLASVDPVIINEAIGALYTTWLGVSVVLERQFARTISMSLSISSYLKPLSEYVIGKPAKMVVPEQYHKWIPVLIGWGCKAAAMSIAWRIQRVLTASTSALAGGLVFSRSLCRMLFPQHDFSEQFHIDDVLGLIVAAVGLYSQIGNGFSFEIPFPISLVTWPFEWAERTIQWQITKEGTNYKTE